MATTGVTTIITTAGIIIITTDGTTGTATITGGTIDAIMMQCLSCFLITGAGKRAFIIFFKKFPHLNNTI
jgi:hypothetical protein